MFTNMLTSHHHRPSSPVSSMTSLNTSNYNAEQKYTPLHNAADAMRRMTSPYSGNLFAGFDESFFARAEALAAVEYPGKNQFKPEPTNSYYPPPASHYQQHPTPHVPAPVYSTMHPPNAFHHSAALQSTIDTNDVIEQLGNSSISTYQPPSFNAPVIPSSEHQPHHYISHPTPTYNPTNHFHPVTSAVNLPIPPPATSSNHNINTASPSVHLPAYSNAELEKDPRELEAFAERFKQRRIKLGVTQNDVGQALANLKIQGVGSLSQSTICRFESLTLSPNNMIALQPILIAWLEKAEMEHRRKENAAQEEKKRKRTSIAAPEKRSLEAYFALQPRPTSEKIIAIANKLDLKKNVVRVWFCNQRQKQKRMKFSAVSNETPWKKQ